MRELPSAGLLAPPSLEPREEDEEDAGAGVNAGVAVEMDERPSALIDALVDGGVGVGPVLEVTPTMRVPMRTRKIPVQ